MNEHEESQRLLNKAKTITSSLQATSTTFEDNKLRVNHLVNPCIIQASAGKRSLGIIKKANPECETLTGRSAAELLGQKVDILMPQSFAVHHDKYFRFDLDGCNDTSRIIRPELWELKGKSMF